MPGPLLSEAYLDVTDYCARSGVSGAQAAEDMRRRVREETKLTCRYGTRRDMRVYLGTGCSLTLSQDV